MAIQRTSSNFKKSLDGDAFAVNRFKLLVPVQVRREGHPSLHRPLNGSVHALRLSPLRDPRLLCVEGGGIQLLRKFH